MNDPDDNDADLIRRISDNRDELALEQLLERHVPRIHSYLRSKFQDALGEPGVLEVMNDTALELWNKASTVEAKSVGGWLITVARNAALDLKKKQDKQPRLFGEHDPVDPIGSDEDESDPEEDRWLVNQLDDFAEGLIGLQRNVMKADIVAGGSADSDTLARLHGSTRNSVEVTRNKVRKKFRDHIKSLELQKSSSGGEQ